MLNDFLFFFPDKMLISSTADIVNINFPDRSTLATAQAKHVGSTQRVHNFIVLFLLFGYFLKGDISYKLKKILERRRTASNNSTLTKKMLNGNQ